MRCKKVIFVLMVLAMLFIAGCIGEERRGLKCKTNADCSWCDNDQFAYKGECEFDEQDHSSFCGPAVTTSCKRAGGQDSKCVVTKGIPTCTQPAQPEAAATVTTKDFAKCLADKGAVMYGAIKTCPDTQAQSRMFGDAFQDLNYKEVNEYRGQEPITETPTWVINGKLYPGKQSFARLAELTGCTTP